MQCFWIPADIGKSTVIFGTYQTVEKNCPCVESVADIFAGTAIISKKAAKKYSKLIINDFFQISLYKDNIMQKSVNRNLIKDVPNGLVQVNNKIINIEYIQEQKLILIFFDTGLVVIYSIYNNILENEYENEERIEYENYIDLNIDEDNKYSYSNISVHISNYTCNNREKQNGIMEIENNDEEEEINNDKEEEKHDIITTFLTLITNKSNINKRKSSIYFFKLEKGKFTDFKNSISFDNKEIVDSIVELAIINEIGAKLSQKPSYDLGSEILKIIKRQINKFIMPIE